MDLPPLPDGPSPAPWLFSSYIYGFRNCLTDRDGRVIGTHLPTGNGMLLEQAPTMAALLREMVSGTPVSGLLERARAILHRIDNGREREPGEDDA